MPPKKVERKPNALSVAKAIQKYRKDLPVLDARIRDLQKRKDKFPQMELDLVKREKELGKQIEIYCKGDDKLSPEELEGAKKQINEEIEAAKAVLAEQKQNDAFKFAIALERIATAKVRLEQSKHKNAEQLAQVEKAHDSMKKMEIVLREKKDKCNEEELKVCLEAVEKLARAAENAKRSDDDQDSDSD